MFPGLKVAYVFIDFSDCTGVFPDLSGCAGLCPGFQVAQLCFLAFELYRCVS